MNLDIKGITNATFLLEWMAVADTGCTCIFPLDSHTELHLAVWQALTVNCFFLDVNLDVDSCFNITGIQFILISSWNYIKKMINIFLKNILFKNIKNKEVLEETTI